MKAFRFLLFFLLAIMLIAGCGKKQPKAPPEGPATLEELGVPVYPGATQGDLCRREYVTKFFGNENFESGSSWRVVAVYITTDKYDDVCKFYQKIEDEHKNTDEEPSPFDIRYGDWYSWELEKEPYEKYAQASVSIDKIYDIKCVITLERNYIAGVFDTPFTDRETTTPEIRRD